MGAGESREEDLSAMYLYPMALYIGDECYIIARTPPSFSTPVLATEKILNKNKRRRNMLLKMDDCTR